MHIAHGRRAGRARLENGEVCRAPDVIRRFDAPCEEAEVQRGCTGSVNRCASHGCSFFGSSEVAGKWYCSLCRVAVLEIQGTGLDIDNCTSASHGRRALRAVQ